MTHIDLTYTAADPSAAYAWCAALAARHYENFPVASRLLPQPVRRHITAVYAFARTADDVADEPWTVVDTNRLRSLSYLRQLVRNAAMGRVDSGHPLLVALSHTIADCGLSIGYFLDLLEAFRRDVRFVPAATWAELMDYCQLSANPVGRLVLRINGINNAQADVCSDAVCTALQLVNFWQDLSVDVPRGRYYLPTAVPGERNAGALRHAFDVTDELFAVGANVLHFVPSRALRWELKCIIAGGRTILQRCRTLDAACWDRRPSLRRSEYLTIALRSLF